jgi:MraZ protein
LEQSGVIDVLRGNCPAKIDEKGRLKVPSAFRAFIEQTYGPQTPLFVTSVSGDCVLVYPMPVWEEKERRLELVPSTLPAKNRYQTRVNYYGQMAELDKQGRVLVHQRVRESAQINGEVDVFGQADHLEIWNHERFVATRLDKPFSEEDGEVLAKYGI